MQKNNSAFWIFFGIFLIGIFLRTYNHGEWLRFNADQARDANVVSDYLAGKEKLPLLGPKAGGTEFKLGGAFYYFQIAAAAVLGNVPDKMAYPDLFFGILTIPLLFFVARRYFEKNIAFAVASVGAVSVFLIKYARFGWNPNSGPFFTLLFVLSLLLVADKKTAKPLLWAGLAGVALGIGVQLHTMLLIIMPITTVLFFGYLYKFANQKNSWKKALIVIAVALALNTGQIVSEMQTGGKNLKAFLGGTSAKTARGSSLAEKILDDATCQIQSNSHIISGLGSDDACGISTITAAYGKSKGFAAKTWIALGVLLGVIFSMGGVGLWADAWRKEKDLEKKHALVLMGMFAIVGFVLLIPLAKEISMRFYLAIIFTPFMFLGFWLTLLKQKLKQSSALLAMSIVVAALLMSNILTIKTAFASFSGKKTEKNNLEQEITLGEARFLATYIETHATANTVLVDGKQKIIFKYLNSMQYFAKQKGIKLKQLSKQQVPASGEMVFYIGSAKNNGKISAKTSATFTAQNPQSHGRFSIVELIKK